MNEKGRNQNLQKRRGQTGKEGKRSVNNKKKAKEQSKKEEEGIIYKIKCKDCHMIYIRETKFTMEKRVQQHKKDVEYSRTGNSAIARHTEKFKHKIDWTNLKCLETEKKVTYTQNYRKCIHQDQQEQVYEPKRGTWG